MGPHSVIVKNEDGEPIGTEIPFNEGEYGQGNPDTDDEED